MGKFEKGNQAKKGKEGVEAESKEIRKASINDFIRCFSGWLSTPVGLIEQIMKDPDQVRKMTALDAIAIKNILQAVKTGRSDHLNRHLDRLWGKAKESLDISNADGTLQEKAKVVIFRLPDNGRD